MSEIAVLEREVAVDTIENIQDAEVNAFNENNDKYKLELSSTLKLKKEEKVEIIDDITAIFKK